MNDRSLIGTNSGEIVRILRNLVTPYLKILPHDGVGIEVWWDVATDELCVRKIEADELYVRNPPPTGE